MIFLVFTATTAIFGGNKLKYGGLSGGSRVIMVAVKAVFCPKSIKTVRFLLVFDTLFNGSPLATQVFRLR